MTSTTDSLAGVSDVIAEQHTTLGPIPSFLDNNGGYRPIDSLVGDHVVWLVEIVVVTVLCGMISAFGLVANVINILVFFKRGALSTSNNVSLLALAFADIGCLLPVFCNSINHALFHLGYAGLFLTPRDFMDTVVIWPHIMCMQIASWITAYIAFERCLCVLLPLKIKSLFSAKKSALVTSSIAMIVIASFLPTFVTQTNVTILDPSTNVTGLIFMPTDFHIQIVEASDVVHATILRPLALLVVFVCTQITVYRVKLSASWRKAITTRPESATAITTTTTTTIATTPSVRSTAEDSSRSATSRAQSSSKEARLVKMVSLISTIFMVCNAPDILGVFVLMSLQARLHLSLMDNLFSLIIAAQLCLESINSSINIFVYYRMSSTYKRTFRVLMGGR